MGEFEKLAAQLARLREQVEAKQEEIQANTEAVEALHNGLRKARKSIKEYTTNELVGSPENLTRFVALIATLLPASAGELLLDTLNHIDLENILLQNGGANNNNNSNSANTDEKNDFVLAILEKLKSRLMVEDSNRSGEEVENVVIEVHPDLMDAIGLFRGDWYVRVYHFLSILVHS
jgi:hypothetical protein